MHSNLRSLVVGVVLRTVAYIRKHGNRSLWLCFIFKFSSKNTTFQLNDNNHIIKVVAGVSDVCVRVYCACLKCDDE